MEQLKSLGLEQNGFSPLLVTSQQEVRESVVSSFFSLLKGLPTLQELTDITRYLPLPRTPKITFLLDNSFKDSLIIVQSLPHQLVSFFMERNALIFSVVGEVDFKGGKK